MVAVLGLLMFAAGAAFGLLVRAPLKAALTRWLENLEER